MSEFTEQLQVIHDKRKRLQIVIDENMTSFNMLIDEVYTDGLHFIWELLQNAEDVDSTEVRFAVDENNNLIFTNNGKPFRIVDIDGITNVGNSSKRTLSDREGKTGKFGIGFKSTFGVCQSIRLHNRETNIRMFKSRFDFELLQNLNFKDTAFVFEGIIRPNTIDEVKDSLLLNVNKCIFLEHIETIIVKDMRLNLAKVKGTFFFIRMHAGTDKDYTIAFNPSHKGFYSCLFHTNKETGLPVSINSKHFKTSTSREDIDFARAENKVILDAVIVDYFVILESIAIEFDYDTDIIMSMLTKNDSNKQFHSVIDIAKTSCKVFKIHNKLYRYNQIVCDSLNLLNYLPELLNYVEYDATSNNECFVKFDSDLFSSVIRKLCKRLQIDSDSEQSKLYLDLLYTILINDDLYERYMNLPILHVSDMNGMELSRLSDKNLAVTAHKHKRTYSSYKSIFYTSDREILELIVSRGIPYADKVEDIVENVTKTLVLTEEDIHKLSNEQTSSLKLQLQRAPIFAGHTAYNTYVASDELKLLMPASNYTEKSYLTDFLEISETPYRDGCNASKTTLDSALRRLLPKQNTVEEMKALWHFLQPQFTSKLNYIGCFKLENLLLRLNQYNIVYDNRGRITAPYEIAYSELQDEFKEIINEYQTMMMFSKTRKYPVYGDEDDYMLEYEVRAVGDKGEKLAYEYFLNSMSYDKVKALNSMAETGEHFDIQLNDNIFVEVKTSTTSSKLQLSRMQLENACICIDQKINGKQCEYWLCHVTLKPTETIVVHKDIFKAIANRELLIHSNKINMSSSLTELKIE